MRWRMMTSKKMDTKERRVAGSVPWHGMGGTCAGTSVLQVAYLLQGVTEDRNQALRGWSGTIDCNTGACEPRY